MAPESEVIIVSNRLPVHRVSERGEDRWETSPGGLVSALKPILQSVESTWIGWTGAAADAPEPFVHDGIRNLPVPITAREIRGYYEGFANRSIWPLYHDAIRSPEFRREWWQVYRQINERFAEAAANAAGEGALVWIHDYHLQLAPAMLRRLRPDVRIGFFLHIPFPPQELFAQLPWRRQLLEGLLGADVVGFQTRVAGENFEQLCRRYLNVRRRGHGLQVGDRQVVAREFPISIDFARFDTLGKSPEVAEQMRIVRERLGERRVILGVDRLDYTKGIDVRMEAFCDLLEAGTCTARDTVFVQVAVPSREQVEEYQELRSAIEELIGRINGQFGEVGLTPIQYLHQSVTPEELAALYRVADVMAVTPCRDGMNLVAKEYVASRTDEDGVLVLSEFTGAAHELSEAVLVNPHDIDGVAVALRTALGMAPGERQRRMHTLRRVVRDNDVHHWARSFYEELAP
jgi:trehalose 6-phosphate synthase